MKRRRVIYKRAWVALARNHRKFNPILSHFIKDVSQ